MVPLSLQQLINKKHVQLQCDAIGTWPVQVVRFSVTSGFPMPVPFASIMTTFGVDTKKPLVLDKGALGFFEYEC